MNDKDKMAPLLVNISQVAKLLGVAVRTARRMDVSGKLPVPVRPGKSKRWRLAELHQWVDKGCPGRTRWESMKTDR